MHIPDLKYENSCIVVHKHIHVHVHVCVHVHVHIHVHVCFVCIQINMLLAENTISPFMEYHVGDLVLTSYHICLSQWLYPRHGRDNG